MQELNIVIVGASGLVGSKLTQLIAESDWPIKTISFHTRVPHEISFRNKLFFSHAINPKQICNADIVFCAAGSDTANQIKDYLGPNTFLIDKSSAFRQDPNIPLIVPEINKHLLKKAPKIISSANCVAVPLSLCLKPLLIEAKIQQCVISTYQSVSGAGSQALKFLSREQKNYELKDEQSSAFFFTKPIHMNIIPHIDTMHDNMWTEEEIKIEQETCKILNHTFPIHASCVRVGVPVGHSANVTVTLDKNISREELVNIYQTCKEVLLVDGVNRYLTPKEIVGTDFCFISRLRVHANQSNIISFWFTCDNLRKGAALNSFQIGQIIKQMHFS